MASIYLSLTDVESRLPHVAITATSKPSIAQVTKWVDEAEARALAELVSVGVTGTLVAGAADILRGPMSDYPTGRALDAMAIASTADPQNGADLLRRYEGWLQHIRDNPAEWKSALETTEEKAVVIAGATHTADRTYTEDMKW